MIPYDDLVVALAAWRQRQGLPVAETAGAVVPKPAPRAAAAAHPAPPAAAPRTAPPAAPPRSPARVVAPEASDFEDGALVEEGQYDAAGDDYVLSLGDPVEATAIGAGPEPEVPLTPKRKPPGW